MNNLITEDIKDRIHNIRGIQIILDRDLAVLYGIETRALKQAVNRNRKRFPCDFMFQLTEKETDLMVSQNVIPSKKQLGGALPYAFTEQGVAMISGILKSKKAVEINIQIMRAFVSMRRFISKNAEIFHRLHNIDQKHIEYDKNFKKIFNAIEDKRIKNKQGIFYNGQVFDAHNFISDLIRSANNSIILIDNYIDDSVLTLFTKTDANVTIYTKTITRHKKIQFTT